MLSLIRSIIILILGVFGSAILLLSEPEELPEAGDLSKAPVEIVEVVDEEPLNEPAPTPQNENGVRVPTENHVGKDDPSEPKVLVETSPETEDVTVEIAPEIIDLIVSIPPVQEGLNLTTNEINIKARGALVNVICISKQGGLLQPITGSGVIIDERGVILTNAHLGQYYLLKDFITTDFLDCTIRTGSPATNTYKAELLYISPSWVKDNYQKIALSNPKGTGEDDFALLLITEVTAPGAILPTSFPSITPDLREMRPKEGESVVVASYPAGFLGGTSIQKDLYAVTTVTKVMEIFTFVGETLDLFSIGGNIAAQKGSSGGAIVNFEGRLSGIVVTASDAAQTDDRDLRAITLSHINRSILKDTGISLNDYLLGGLQGKSFQFRSVVAPELTALLESALNAN